MSCRVIVFDESTPDETLVIPLAPGTLVPNVPEPGINMPANRSSIPGLQVIRGRALIGADPTVFLYVKADLVRNLYRVPLL